MSRTVQDTRECPVEGCEVRHSRDLLMCRGHWYSVPKPLRDELWRAFRSDEGIFGDAYHEAREACIRAAEGR